MNIEFFNSLLTLNYKVGISKMSLLDIAYKAIGSLDFSPDIVITTNKYDDTTTDYYACMQALVDYNDYPSLSHEIEVLLRIGDIYSQLALVKNLHLIHGSNHSLIIQVINEITKAINNIKENEFFFKDEEVVAINSIKIISREIFGKIDSQFESKLAQQILLKIRNII